MKAGLSARVAASHVILVAFALAVFVVSVASLTRHGVADVGAGVDRAVAIRLAPWLERYYRRTGSWAGVEELLKGELSTPAPVPATDDPARGGPPRRSSPWPIRRPRDSDGHMMPMMHERGRAFSSNQPIVVVGPDDRPVAIHGIDPIRAREIIGEAADGAWRDRGVALRGTDGVVAWLLVGSMIAGERNQLRDAVMETMSRAIALTALLVLSAVTVLSAWWARWLLRPIRALDAAAREIATGHYEGRVAVPSGEHELSMLARSFNTMAREVALQERSRRRFVADAAHELRTPIALVAARVDMLRDGVYRPGPDQWTALSRDIDRLGTLVDDLQLLARADAGRLALARTSMDLDALIRDARDRFTPAAEAADVTLNALRSAAELPRVAVDPSRMGQVFTNIIGNALRYAPRGSTVRIEGGRLDDATVYVAVEDAGPGIPEVDRERVFERFVRLDTHRGRDEGGSGLGLAIAAEIVRAHDGSIRIEAARHSETGSRF
ncbi:MAG: ATP-binding protein, partial [Spirochaetales bacterium]|nr:ATP-binding protein [Spirochaetales bacterium]